MPSAIGRMRSRVCHGVCRDADAVRSVKNISWVMSDVPLLEWGCSSLSVKNLLVVLAALPIGRRVCPLRQCYHSGSQTPAREPGRRVTTRTTHCVIPTHHHISCSLRSASRPPHLANTTFLSEAHHRRIATGRYPLEKTAPPMDITSGALTIAAGSTT